MDPQLHEFKLCLFIERLRVEQMKFITQLRITLNENYFLVFAFILLRMPLYPSCPRNEGYG